jgi:hypothetical protein
MALRSMAILRGDCAVLYRRGNRTLAVATVSRDLQSLQYEAAMESGQMGATLNQR